MHAKDDSSREFGEKEGIYALTQSVCLFSAQRLRTTRQALRSKKHFKLDTGLSAYVE